MLEHIWLIPLLPFASALIIFFFGDWLPLGGAWLGLAAILCALVQSLALFVQCAAGSLPLPYESAFTWFRFGVFETEVGFLVDGLTIVMLVVVTLVSALVQLYSLGYMKGDPRFKRFYAYLSLFTASMLSLVVANNMLMFFVSWELVGVCSYLLISFWFEKPSAAYAGKKAFITTKLADLGFFLGILAMFWAAGTFNIQRLASNVAQGYVDPAAAGLIALLLYCGAMGKSAQVPLFIWLPDAMEGPTPVSALIHAATMVAAGVYMVARLYFLFAVAPGVLYVVAWFGGITAFLAASMAFASYDIKRVLAFSTVSQLGYMMMALGCGDLTAGMFHLTTHAVFKALLFLGAGSVIHAVHTNDMREMGGLRKKMPLTFWAMLAATLAISGIPPFAGFYSKDEILAAALSRNLPVYLIGAVTAGMTSFYMFRLMFMTFFGEPKDAHAYEHAHESPWTMGVPLAVLGILSVVAGAAFAYTGGFERFVYFDTGAAAAPLGHWALASISTAIALAGIGLSYLFYVARPDWAASAKQAFLPVFNLLERRYYLDDFFLDLVSLSDALSRLVYWFDFNFVDQLVVDGYGYATLLLSRLDDWFDSVIVDGAVDGAGLAAYGTGALARALQTGFVQNYLLYVAAGAAVLATLLLAR